MLAVLVTLGTILAWVVLLVVRKQRRLPISQAVSERSFFAAFEFGGAVTGAAFPTAWIVGANIVKAIQTGEIRFDIAGNLPPGVQEQDLVAILLVGSVILLIRGFYRYRAHLSDVRPGR
jgi:hypothetical protein